MAALHLAGLEAMAVDAVENRLLMDAAASDSHSAALAPTEAVVDSRDPEGEIRVSRLAVASRLEVSDQRSSMIAS